MIEHYVEDDFHPAFVRLVNEGLKTNILRLIAMIDSGEVMGVITMVVVPRSILHHRRDPNRRETQRLDIIEFLYQTFKITAPSRVSGILIVVIPTLRVIRRVSIVKTRGDDKIDLLVTKIRARREKRSGVCCQNG